MTEQDSSAENLLVKNPFTCTGCGKTFSTEKELSLHLSVGQSTFKCIKCESAFCTASNLFKHTTSKHPEGIYKCSLCEKTYNHLGRLMWHMEWHKGNKKLSKCPKTTGPLPTKNTSDHVTCEKCGKWLSSVSSLKRHMSIHSETKKFKCILCGCKFLRMYTLQVHFRRHTGEMPYECDICHKSFPEQNALKGHVTRHAIKFLCKICGQKELSKSDASEHLKKEHGIESGEANEEFLEKKVTHFPKGKPRLEKHVIGHIKQSDLNMYVKTEGKKDGEARHKCKVCGASYRSRYMKVHMRYHTGERPYACTKCDKTFTVGHHLKNHMLLHRRQFKCEICKTDYTTLSELKSHSKVQHLNMVPPDKFHA